jgi:hypothetical protein
MMARKIGARIDGDRAKGFDGFDQHQQARGCSVFVDFFDDLVKAIEPF